jgi:hypothetical protein
VTARTASSATRRPLVAASAWLFGFAKYGTDRRPVRVLASVLASEALGGRGAVREEGEPGRGSLGVAALDATVGRGRWC